MVRQLSWLCLIWAAIALCVGTPLWYMTGSLWISAPVACAYGMAVLLFFLLFKGGAMQDEQRRAAFERQRRSNG